MEKTREWKQYLMVILGSALFAASVNLLIVPLSLYSAGIVGIAQILRTLLVPLMPFAAGFDVAGIINLLLNIPLFLLAFRSISRGFFVKTVISIIVQTAVMSLVPIPSEPILGDMARFLPDRRDPRRTGRRTDAAQQRKLRRNGHHRASFCQRRIFRSRWDSFPSGSMWCCTASVR